MGHQVSLRRVLGLGRLYGFMVGSLVSMIGWAFCWRKRQGGHSNIMYVPGDGRDKDIGHCSHFATLGMCGRT